MNRTQYLCCEQNFEDRIWLRNNLPFLLFNTKSCDIARICDIILSHKPPSFAQIKVLSILIYKFEKYHLQNEDLKQLLEVLFKFATLIDDKNIFLLRCFLKVICVFASNLPEAKIDLRIAPLVSNCLYKNMIFIVHRALSKEPPSERNILSNMERVENHLIHSVSISEEVDSDILSVLVYFQKVSPRKNFNFNFCKFIFYFCTDESTHSDAFYLVSLFMGKKYFSILSMLKEFLHYNHLSSLLKHSDILRLYEDLNKALNNLKNNYTETKCFYQVEGDGLVCSDILKNLLRNLIKDLKCFNAGTSL